MKVRSEREETWARLRSRLFGVAYRMLGTSHDADDVLQNAWLRWNDADGPALRNPEAWLVAVTTRLAIDRLRQAAAERERYVGDWLPEPIATGAPSPHGQLEQAADVSMAFLVLLERLSPVERAALLLHDVLGAGYDEVAGVLERSVVACRQIVHRARARVQDERRRFEAPVEVKQRLVSRFLAALAASDERELLAVVAEDATWTADGGGKIPVARNLRTARRIVGFLLRLDRHAERRTGRRPRREVAWVNGEPTVLTWADDHRLFSTTSLVTDGARAVAF
jgi:RNA polymerase sigma-70 factor, ECF subfamily